MPRPRRSSTARALWAERRRFTHAALVQHLALDGDPLGLGPSAREIWREHALLAPPSLLVWRGAERVAAGLRHNPRATPWAEWIERELQAAALELATETPLAWRAVPTEPTPFERSVAACFGIADHLAAPLIVAFHRVERARRQPLHELLPHALFGVPTRRAVRGLPARRARAQAECGLALLRHLVAHVRTSI